ncbi:DNA ligase D [Mangrovicella endophytica]|uniref:DNA ligase D n=1 Tax=Mangrovicella endophytica TaxID=2066697 RepID=UPI000C9DD1D2|nr:DNA ligase D [Mangrovicella endophytica]
MATKADTLLKAYRDKRDFSKTAEPSGAAERAGAEGLTFCVQKHDATRLHYDFRIEWHGVLKSWAVTKGPSYDPKDKRLAVRTEDHPLEYGDFEGIIPKGQYGGGTVMLWDTGTWEPQNDPEEGLRDGSVKMLLKGEKLSGHWALVRMKPRPGEKRENWLLIKEKDEAADPTRDIVTEKPDSVKTGRDLDAIAAGHDAVWQSSRGAHEATASPSAKKGKSSDRAARGATASSKGGRDTADAETSVKSGTSGAAPAGRSTAKPKGKALPLPAFRPVQLATLVDAPPEGDGWLHEMKYDGYRVLIAVAGEKAVLYTRNENDWTDRFAPLLPAVLALPCRSALIDGEVVAFDPDGRTDFSTLQMRLSEGGDLACFCFDLLELDGEDLTTLPLRERKRKLEALIAAAEQPALLYSEHITGSGAAVFKSICSANHEGIVAKRADAPYSPGRTKSWLKVKCKRRQEFVIGGYAPSDKTSRPFSSILLGVHEGGQFRYRGKVGSGFGQDIMLELKRRFTEIARKTSPFAELPRPIARTSRFVEPVLVAEIEYAEMTADGSIRHGVFMGLREDKPAEDVVDETAADVGTVGEAESNEPAAAKAQQPKRRASAPSGTKAATKKAAPATQPKDKAAAGGDTVAGIKLTHPERVVFESQGVTKLDLARYYEAVSERMLAHAGRRPLSLVRCPQGGARHCFFQKHDSGGFPAAIRKIPITEKDGSTEDYLYVEDAAGLVAAVQMNTMEFHIWGSRNDRIENPDRLIFDLDPDEGLNFEDVKAAARDLRGLLKELKLDSLPMVTGGKGVHVVVPLNRRQAWPAVKAFARGFAYRLAEAEPKRFIATMSKAKRKGLIFVDWLRNERGSTAIAPYSTRSRTGAPVATPVSWEELEGLDRANGFTLDTVLARLDEPDPWADYGSISQGLTKAALKAVGADIDA